jgi:twitching motility two-component system response regulator PilH
MTDQREVIINGILKCRAMEISEEGMYINTAAEFVSGAVLDTSFTVDNTTVKVKAVVQEVHPGIGIKIKFLNLSPEYHPIIKNAVTQAAHVSSVKAEKKILLVDDSAQSRAIYRNKLNLDGFVVTEAANGVEALKHLQEIMPDLVILDLWMDGIDGFKILQLMQMNPKLKAIPVVVLSARSVPADIQKAISLGARDFLPKMATTPVKLAEKVKEILSKTA